MNFESIKSRSLCFIGLFLLFSPLPAIDVNSNGLSDIWEQRFDAGDAQADADDDGDGYDNLDECIAGTDPYDVKDRPELLPEAIDGTNTLSFKTAEGKYYTIEKSAILSDYEPINRGWIGDGEMRSLKLDEVAPSKTRSPVRWDFWADIDPSSLENLIGSASFPYEPDGRLFGPSIEAPLLKATGYGARLTTWIVAPESGNFTFFISSGGPAVLNLRTTNESEEPTKLAEILPLQTGLAPEQWTTYETQRSDFVQLIAGNLYFLELCYVAAQERQHCQIGWSGPSLEGIEKIDTSNLAEINFLGAAFEEEAVLFEHSYETGSQSEALWLQNTTIEMALPGMEGWAERVTGDVGNFSQEFLSFNGATTEHLYATFLFNMERSDDGVRENDHDDVNLLFVEGIADNREGPRIHNVAGSGGTRAFVRGGGPGGNEERIEIDYNTTYRLELLTTLSPDGFTYATPSGEFTVDENRFDLFISTASGDLLDYARNMTFRDPDPNDSDSAPPESLNAIRLAFTTRPNLQFDDWEITTGRIKGNGYILPNLYGSEAEGLEKQFFRLTVTEQDQDGDGLMDWEELSLGEFFPVLFFDSETIDGTVDQATVASVLSETDEIPEVALFATDASAYESNYPSSTPDNGEITITRSGRLTPLTVSLHRLPMENTGDVSTFCNGSCCTLVGSAGDESAELADYQLIDEDGNRVTDTLYFDFGETEKRLQVIAINDTINEYPETLNLAIADCSEESYLVSELLNGASIQLFDLPDNPDNITILTGAFSRDGAAVTSTNGTGLVTATINGPRTEMRFWNNYSGLTSNQQDSHIHKSGIGNSPGPIIYAITNEPGEESSPAPASDPFNGLLEYYPILVLSGNPVPVGVQKGNGYPWDLTESSGAVPTNGGSASKQTIIDSLFGQNGETPLYLNIHTVANPAGEIWAFLNLSEGSIEDPGDAPAAPPAGTSEYPQLTGELLEAEVRRFLNQATFGATELEVTALHSKILEARVTDPNYHRDTAFREWIDQQMDRNLSGQTYLMEYTLAAHYQYMTLAGLFDPALNPSQAPYVTPSLPSDWPNVVRPHSETGDPALWHLDTDYPVVRNDFLLAGLNNLRAEPRNNQRRHAHWQTMINGRDQLRQKTGFALQQIVVASSSVSIIRNNPYGAANYQDLINAYAFDHYRDILGFVNWSPIMGKWLSSLQNQKAIDFDGDGLFDAFPDENLARENMQLFSIGLVEQWADGTLKLSSEGLPRATYTNDDIREFARILTGQSFSHYTTSTRPWTGGPYQPNNDRFSINQNPSGILTTAYIYPMKMFGDFHDPGVKSFIGTTIDNTDIDDLEARGIADIEDAIDWLAGKPGDGLPDFDMVNSHVSTPAFISKRLIQRFTTSNPSKEYLHRVATIFKNTEGHLGATIRAILLDPEARNINLNETVFGLKKSPLEGYLQLLRSLEAFTYVPLENPNGASPYQDAIGDYSNPNLYLEAFDYPQSQLNQHERNVRFLPNSAISAGTRGLQMDPFRQETVFNYYSSDFSPSGPIANAGLVAPEMQLANEPDIVRNINFFEDIIRTTLGPGGSNLGGNDETQNRAFGTSDNAARDHEAQRLAHQEMADLFYPVSPPDPGNTGRTSESLADELLIDELDRRLTNGLFKLRYPYDSSDDDDPAIPGVDDWLKNPRELIIDAITNGHRDPFTASDPADERNDKFRDALYLLTYSPEYQIKK